MGSGTKKILENSKKIYGKNFALQSNIIDNSIDIENAEIVFEEDLNQALNQTEVFDALNQVLSQPENDLYQVFNDLEKNQNGILNVSDLHEDLEQPYYPAVRTGNFFQSDLIYNNIDLGKSESKPP